MDQADKSRVKGDQDEKGGRRRVPETRRDREKLSAQATPMTWERSTENDNNSRNNRDKTFRLN